MSVPSATVAGLYAMEGGALRRHVRRKLANPESAEDVVHDACVRFLSLSAGHPTVRSPKAFLFTVAANLAVDSARRDQRALRLFAAVDHESDGHEPDFVCPRPSVEEQVDAQLRLSTVMLALEALPPKYRAAFRMHKLHELSYAEVAKRMGVSVSMVEKYLMGALHHLRQCPALSDSGGAR